ncbi:indoleamine 2,3-dioxygenase 1 [Polypterus senegalus]|uniref:indoleamine 2,3-dioxygenase 1 n=1 Tax=Polypterus senegalus TaxID=55291 RepID=UPI00196565AB|nr:indoleamine 2,3-dioxygenase 1 [Polypterus senegalus]
MASSMSETSHVLDMEHYHVTEDHGFILPEPLTNLSEYYQPWMEIADKMPFLIKTHSLREEVNKMPLLDTKYLNGYKEQRLAHLALSFITMGYVWQEGEQGSIKALPQNLAIPFWNVSQCLGLPAILVHGDSALANWKKKDPNGPFELENLDVIFSFPGEDSAKGFFLVTLLVEMAAVPGIKAAVTSINAMIQKDDTKLHQALQDIADSIECMVTALKMMQGNVDPQVFYGVIRIFLSGWRDNPSMPDGLVYEGVHEVPKQFSGGSAAQSSVLHCFDALLGVSHSGESGNFLNRMQDYMPPSHRQLIQDIASSPSLQQYIVDSRKPKLQEAFNNCVSQLVKLRNQHIIIVTNFILVPAAKARDIRKKATSNDNILLKAPSALEERGTGGSGIMSFLKSVRDTTKVVCVPSAH